MKQRMSFNLVSLFSCFFLTFFFVERGYPQEAEVSKFPNRPITFIVPLPAGAGPEVASRLIAKEAEKFLGQRN